MAKGKPNATGRNEGREHFARLARHLMEEPAWRALSSAAQSLYPWLRLEWRRPEANNNAQRAAGRVQDGREHQHRRPGFP